MFVIPVLSNCHALIFITSICEFQSDWVPCVIAFMTTVKSPKTNMAMWSRNCTGTRVNIQYNFLNNLTIISNLLFVYFSSLFASIFGQLQSYFTWYSICFHPFWLALSSKFELIFFSKLKTYSYLCAVLVENSYWNKVNT